MERRRLPRRAPARDEPLSRVRLRTGCDLTVVDASNHGLLVEGARLLPGTRVDVHVVTIDGRVLVRSRVVRAYVAALRGDAVIYRGALAFERTVDTSMVPEPGWLSLQGIPASNAFPLSAPPAPRTGEPIPSLSSRSRDTAA